MIIRRYFNKELIYTSLGVIGILLVIFIGHASLKYLKYVLRGAFPVSYIMKMVFLEIPYLLSLLIPLGFYLSAILVYSRMYADQEMVVLLTSGISRARLLSLSLMSSIVISQCVAVFSLWLGPLSINYLSNVRTVAKSDVLSKLLAPGQFSLVDGGKKVIYIDNFTKDTDGNNLAHGLFVAEHPRKPRKTGYEFEIILAENGKVATHSENKLQYVVLEDGIRYSRNDTKGGFRSIEFEKYLTKLPSVNTTFNYTENIMSLDELLDFSSGSRRLKLAEFHWRISHPISVLIFILLAFSISRTEPRKGKYSKILPGVLIYIGYYNLLFFGRNAIKEGTIPPVFGLWWVHTIFLILGIILFNNKKILRYLKS
ncbi:MAG: LPS export ABC transporter permease LptF [Legionellales bacterium]|nr:LPS export ABC transporter permease LptF [Legionellales bacterium]